MYTSCMTIIHTKSFIIDNVIVCLLQQVSCILQQFTQYFFIYLPVQQEPVWILVMVQAWS